MNRTSLTSMKKLLKPAIVVTCATPALLLAACGDATVESSDVTTSATAEKPATASEKATEQSTAKTTKPKDANDITDDAAERVDEEPAGTMPLSKDDEGYLDALIDQGIDVAGAEDQLIAAGRAQCDEMVTDEEVGVLADAVAGQMIAQGRTDAKAENVAKAIADAAKKAYC
ncbi:MULTISPECIES: DUF732 domain-containing protein [unclassified Corynebacterium]|uniref:DUF732 domain-containing protein n=1 Tax=unclassified Corynebacterium TaxID=2624378 RepID=UPI0030A2A9B5